MRPVQDPLAQIGEARAEAVVNLKLPMKRRADAPRSSAPAGASTRPEVAIGCEAAVSTARVNAIYAASDAGGGSITTEGQVMKRVCTTMRGFCAGFPGIVLLSARRRRRLAWSCLQAGGEGAATRSDLAPSGLL